MPAEPIRYFHRTKQVVETEEIYGGDWLRWTYETGLGKFALNALVKRAAVSRYYGWKMSQKGSAHRVLPFIVDYNLDVDEFAKKPYSFKTFNEFFYRALKPEARPIAAGDRVAVFPADGRHLAFPDVDAADGFYVKGMKFTLAELLGEDGLPADQRPLSARFAGGAMLISRLCPVDYHRFHFPVAGTPDEPRLLNGWLYSVSPIALRRRLRYLVENKRAITLVESAEFGSVAVIEVGATNVGSIKQSFVPGRAIAKGTEKGFFAFGGSCVITLFQRGRIRLDGDVVAQSADHVETYARMGDRLGEATS